MDSQGMSTMTKVIISIFVLLVIGAIIGGVVYAVMKKNTTFSTQSSDKDPQVPKKFMGQFIKINRPSKGWFHIQGIKVSSHEGGENIITPNMSVTMSGPNTGSRYLPSNILVGADRPDDFSAHSAGQNEDNPSITINLGSMVPIHNIILYARKFCCRNMMNGSILTIMDNNSNIVYEANPLKSATGSLNTSDGDGYRYYKYTIPDKTPIGTDTIPSL